eukprot:9082543-Alexandrium_andersonii.AAC.1
MSPEVRRQRMLEAAERRQVEVPGMSKQKVEELREGERQQNEEVIGRLAEHYKRNKIEPPH